MSTKEYQLAKKAAEAEARDLTEINQRLERLLKSDEIQNRRLDDLERKLNPHWQCHHSADGVPDMLRHQPPDA